MGKLIVVSGGTRGIGRAIIEKFANEGFDVAVSARNENDLSNLKRSIEAQYSVQCHIYRADMSVKSEVEAFVKFVRNLNQPVEVLVNNAGLFIAGNVHDAPDGAIESQIETNLYSAFYLTKGLAEGMKERRNGYIFNICSIASLIAYPNGGLYAISKFAMLGFSKSLREEMKPYGVRVSSIMPGAVLTDSWAGVDLPKERFIQPQDVADTIWTAFSLTKSAVLEEIIIRPQEGDI
ncbi:MAG: SDR family oxidoreductase [Spirosomataceae bacterium]